VRLLFIRLKTGEWTQRSGTRNSTARTWSHQAELWAIPRVGAPADRTNNSSFLFASNVFGVRRLGGLSASTATPAP